MPTGLQTYAKVVQMHFSGGGGTTWLHPKSNGTFYLALSYVFKFLTTGVELKYFHYTGHCAHKAANFCKKAANATFRGWGDNLVVSQK